MDECLLPGISLLTVAAKLEKLLYVLIEEWIKKDLMRRHPI
jgi:hypothetical protein